MTLKSIKDKIKAHENLKPEEGVDRKNTFITTLPFTQDCRTGLVMYMKDDTYCVKVCDPNGDMDVVIDEQEEGATIYRFSRKKVLH